MCTFLQELKFTLQVFNFFFTSVFILEAVVKILALGLMRYLSDRSVRLCFTTNIFRHFACKTYHIVVVYVLSHCTAHHLAVHRVLECKYWLAGYSLWLLHLHLYLIRSNIYLQAVWCAVLCMLVLRTMEIVWYVAVFTCIYVLIFLQSEI